MALINPLSAVLQKLADVIAADPDIEAFCQEKYKRSMATRLSFHKRAELMPAAMPLSMITCPKTEVENLMGMQAKLTHHVLIYLMISQEDKDKALIELMELEELVDQALMRNSSLGGLVSDIDPSQGSANDEGWFHPKYSVVKIILVKRHVSQEAR